MWQPIPPLLQKHYQSLQHVDTAQMLAACAAINVASDRNKTV